MNDITTLDIAAVLKPVWTAKPEVARKLYPAIRRVFEYARIRLRDDHGLSRCQTILRAGTDLKAMGFEAPAQLTRGRHPSLPHERLPTVSANLRARDAIAARALEFLILTNVRTDAVLKLRRAELRLGAGAMVGAARQPERPQIPEGSVPRAVVRAGGRDRAGDGAGSKSRTTCFPAKLPRSRSRTWRCSRSLKRMNSVATEKWVDPTDQPFDHRARLSRDLSHLGRGVHRLPPCGDRRGHGAPSRQAKSSVPTAGTDVLEKRRELMRAWANYCAGGPTISNRHRIPPPRNRLDSQEIDALQAYRQGL